MNVVCIKNKGITNWLTIGKTYEVIIQKKLFYKIIKDWYPKNKFKPISEYRNEKINKLILGL